MSQANRSLMIGAEHPYDSDDEGEALPPKDWAHVAARGVVADLLDRRDIKQALSKVDFDIRVEIVSAISAIIRCAESARMP